MQESFILQDEEHKAKLQECMDLLLAAGYFKVRIKNVDIFDKLIGGMVWCLSSTDADIDSSLLYMENLNIREKIYISQHVVKVLNDIKCPHKIEPHQIQGYDLFKIYPVLQWLVKQAYSARKDNEVLTRNAIEWNFARDFVFSKTIDKSLDISSNDVHQARVINNSSVPSRRYFKKSSNRAKSLKLDVTCTLKEFSYFDKLIENESLDNTKDSKDKADESLNNELIQVDSSFLFANLNKLVVPNIEKISQAQQIFSQKKSRIEEEIKKFKNLPLTPKQELARFQDKIEKSILTYKEMKEKVEALEKTHKEANYQLSSAVDENEKLEAEIREKEQRINFSDKYVQEVYDKLERFMELKETQRISRAKYKEEISQLENQLSQLRSTEIDGSKEAQLKSELEALLEERANFENQVKSQQESIALLNKHYMGLKIKSTDQLNAEELSYFQKRFVELYSHQLLVHREAEKYYELYNNLSDLCKVLKKESNIIESILITFEKAQTLIAQAQFNSSVEKISKSVVDSYRTLNDNLSSIVSENKRTTEHHQTLVSKLYLYNKLAKEFKTKIGNTTTTE